MTSSPAARAADLRQAGHVEGRHGGRFRLLAPEDSAVLAGRRAVRCAHGHGVSGLVSGSPLMPGTLALRVSSDGIPVPGK